MSFIFIFLKFNDSLVAPTVSTIKTVGVIPQKPIGIYVTVILSMVILIAAVALIFYAADQALKHSSLFHGLKGWMKKNYFLILIAFPLFYLIYHYTFYLPYHSADARSVWLQEDTAEMLWSASITFLVTGTVTAALKWLNNLAFFKKQFSDLIRSDDFSTVLSEKMKELALSDEYLLARNDLEEIWTRVTVCKYQQKFPELTEEIQKKIENDLFLEQSLSYYYKNFRLQINFSIEDNIVKITEISSFTVISHTTEKIEINFGTTSPVVDEGEIYTRFIPEGCKCDGMPLMLSTGDGQNIGNNNIVSDVIFKAPLEGSKKYIIERQVEMTQNINDDRVFTFSSSRIIEDLSLNLKYDDKLNLFFSPVGKNVFHKDNQLRSLESQSYISRDLLLPGEKFKIFIFKKS